MLISLRRGRFSEPEQPEISAHTNGRGPSVLLVGLTEETRKGLATGQAVHLRVPVGEGIIDLVIVGSDTEADELPPPVVALLQNASLVVQVTDDDGGL